MKIEKVLEKFLACKGVLKIQICSGKIKKVEKSKMMEGENEICTDLPSARARRLESDEQDLSPTVFTIARLVLRIGRGRACDLTPYLLCLSFLGSGGRRS